MKTPPDVQLHKDECLERWRKYWRLAQTVAALPDLMQRQEAVRIHEKDYPWFPDMVIQAWEERKKDIERARRESQRKRQKYQ